MSRITTFNSLARQLLIHLGDDDGTDLIMNAFNGRHQIKVLRALAFNNKTIPQLRDSTGISEGYLYRVVQKLAKLGLIEVKRTVPNKNPEKGGSEVKVWGLV